LLTADNLRPQAIFPREMIMGKDKDKKKEKKEKKGKKEKKKK
jgi:hypothetical protein